MINDNLNLTKYANMFGAPKTGIHSYRIYNVAIIDVIFVLIFAYIITLLYDKFNLNKYIKISIGLFILGIILHRIFGVRTTIDKLLFK